MIRRTIVFSLALTASAVCLAAQTVTERPSNLPAELQAPERVGRYIRGDMRDFGNETMGIAYQYAPAEKDSGNATVYFFRRQPERRGASAETVLAAEMAVFKQTLDIQVQRGLYDSYKVAFEAADSVRAGSRVLPGYKLFYAYKRGSSVYVSFFYLLVVDDALLKVRATVPETHWERSDLPGFAREIASRAVRVP